MVIMSVTGREAAEDYDACEAVQEQIDALTAQHVVALRLIPEGVPPSVRLPGISTPSEPAATCDVLARDASIR
jgi:hypothetical protein